MLRRRPWPEELAIIDRTMRAISSITDPETMVTAYFEGIGDLLPVGDYVSLSRRNVTPPRYLITRSSRFTEDINPFTQRDRLPVLTGGILGDIVYANAPVLIDDLPDRLRPDDPGHFYLTGFQHLVALPQYDNGESLNVTCMLFPAGKQLDPAAIPMLHWQSGLFGRGTTNLVLRNQLASALASLDRELQTVGEIQKSLLPETLPGIPGFDLAAYYRTSARAGGDYYDFFPLSDGSWGIFIADVSGHGTPAAVLMAITHALAHAHPGTHTPPCQLLTQLNASLTRSYTRNGTFITAFYAVLNPESRTLSYALAGHNPPRLRRNDSILPLDQNGALPLGILPAQPYVETMVQLQANDLLLLYTDGITESPAPTPSITGRELFGTGKLDDLLVRCSAHTSPQECITCILDALTTFTNNAAPTDDQTLIALRCL